MRMSKSLLLILAICLCLSGCGNSEEVSEKQQALKQEGMELQSAGDYSGAIAKYEEALRLSNMVIGEEEIDLAYYKASAQYHGGDLAGTIDTYSAVIELKKDIDGYLGRGLLYVTAKDAEKAEADLNKALKETNDPLIKGIIYNVVGDTDASFYLAGIYEKAGDANYAMILLEEYIASGKASAEGYLSVARRYMDAESYGDALETIQAGIALGESGVLKSLMQEEIACYERLGNFETAREKAEGYLEKYPDDEVIKHEYEFLKSR